ncbi:MAG: hypothetical protein K2N12_07510, partial [Helicobacter sp.]|nr:hypothetical protein [Helicobacter sp.]
IVITASKGADNITLTAGANHDVIEFGAGGGAGNVQEEYTVDLGNMSLSKYQSFTIDGLTITNISGNKLNAYAVADAITQWINNGNSYNTAGGAAWEIKYTSANGTIAGSSGAANTLVNITGELESLKGAWKGATIEWQANSNQFVVKAPNGGNLTDLNFTFAGNGNTAIASGASASLSLSAASANAAVAGATAGGTTANDITLNAVGDGTNANVTTVSLNGVEIKVEATASTAFTAAQLVTEIKSLVENGTYSATAINGTNVKLVSVGTFTTVGSGDAENVKALFALPEGYAWNFDTTNGKISFEVTDTQTTQTLSAVISQSNTDTANYTAPGAVTFTGTAYSPATDGKIVVDFKDGLLAGQSYTFNGKTILATSDLTGEQVAEAFTYKKGEAFDGAVIVADWTAANIVEAKVAYGIDGSKLTILDIGPGAANGTPSGILSPATNVLTGTGALGVNIKNVSGSTTQQGQAEEEILADSYVTFSFTAGNAPSGAGSAGVVTVVKANTNALDTITNFDVSNDKLALNKFDINNDGTAGKYLATDGASLAALSGDAIYLDTAGSTLAASAANGIFSFSTINASGATTGADSITLEHKLFAALNNITANKVAGFEHAGDFYVIATGANANSTTDDLVIKLAGVSGITDIGTILG